MILIAVCKVGRGSVQASVTVQGLSHQRALQAVVHESFHNLHAQGVASMIVSIHNLAAWLVESIDQA